MHLYPFVYFHTSDLLKQYSKWKYTPITKYTYILILNFAHIIIPQHCITENHFCYSKNYSYPIISRVRRSLLQTLEQGIQVLIKPPGIEWDKTLGSSNIGASFGLHIRNILDLKLGMIRYNTFDKSFLLADTFLIGIITDLDLQEIIPYLAFSLYWDVFIFRKYISILSALL